MRYVDTCLNWVSDVNPESNFDLINTRVHIFPIIVNSVQIKIYITGQTLVYYFSEIQNLFSTQKHAKYFNFQDEIKYIISRHSQENFIYFGKISN